MLEKERDQLQLDVDKAATKCEAIGVELAQVKAKEISLTEETDSCESISSISGGRNSKLMGERMSFRFRSREARRQGGCLREAGGNQPVLRTEDQRE